jgi:hypothetical protein
MNAARATIGGAILFVLLVAAIPDAPPLLRAVLVLPFVLLGPGLAFTTRMQIENSAWAWTVILSSSVATVVVVTTVLAYIGLLTPLWTLTVVGAIIFFVSRERS